jgi:hypothetical protein
MKQSLPETWFLKDAKVNAAVSWVLTVLLGVTAIVYFLVGSVVVMAVAAVATIVAVVPALVARSWTRTVPWPMLLLAVAALLTGVLSPSFVGISIFALAIAALSMLVVVTLQLTTTVRMTPSFAIGFMILATMAMASLWALGSAASAQWFGTAFVATNDQLMIIFTSALLASGVSAVMFWRYFRRQLVANLAERSEGGTT